MHPQVIGRGHRMKMLERFIKQAEKKGVRFLKCVDAVLEWKKKE